MAKIYFKISKQDIDYYFLWDSYFEKPYTIPMDLASFMVYLSEDESSLYGIIASWKNLKLNSTSLNDIISEPFFNDTEYNYLYFQTEDEYIKNTAIKNIELSKLVYEQLEKVSNRFDDIVNGNAQPENLLIELNQEFIKFITEQIQGKSALLPKCFYSNIDDLYDKLHNQIASEKMDDFLRFIYNIEAPTKSEVDWYCKLLYSNNIEWHNIPMAVRANFLITDSNVKINEENKSPFLRNIDNVTITNYYPTRKDLLGYYNHLIAETFNFAIEVKDYLEELGFIDKKNSLTLSNLNFLIDNELLNSEDLTRRMPNELVNFIDSEGGKLLPPIYDRFFERQGLYVFYKYNIQLIDVYTKNGDLVFSNLYDIDIFLIDNEIVVTYEDGRGYKYFKKVIIQEGKSIQILTIPPFENPHVNF